MVFVFCASYLSVVDTIRAIEAEEHGFLVLTSNPSIWRLFTELYTSNNVLLLPDVPTSFSHPSQFLRTQITIVRAKKSVFQIVSKLRPTRMIFFFVGFNGLESWILKKLSHTSEVYYRPGVNTSYLRRSFNCRVWFAGLLASLSYGVIFIPKPSLPT